jgi:hypothetical protein
LTFSERKNLFSGKKCSASHSELRFLLSLSLSLFVLEKLISIINLEGKTTRPRKMDKMTEDMRGNKEGENVQMKEEGFKARTPRWRSRLRHYKPAGRGFDSRWCQWIFSLA